MKTFLRYFLSLKLTVTLLSLSMVLVFCGTLAQVDKGIWTVMEQYFRTWIAWIDLSIFTKSESVASVSLPFPGGFLIGSLLSLNLLIVHAKTFRIFVRGKRLIIGSILLFSGLILTAGVILGWGFLRDPCKLRFCCLHCSGSRIFRFLRKCNWKFCDFYQVNANHLFFR